MHFQFWTEQVSDAWCQWGPSPCPHRSFCPEYLASAAPSASQPEVTSGHSAAWPGYFPRISPVPFWTCGRLWASSVPCGKKFQSWTARCVRSHFTPALLPVWPRAVALCAPSSLYSARPGKLILDLPSPSAPVISDPHLCWLPVVFTEPALLLKIQAVLSQTVCAHSAHAGTKWPLQTQPLAQLQHCSLGVIWLFNPALQGAPSGQLQPKKCSAEPELSVANTEYKQTKPQQQQTLKLPLL